MPFYRTCSNALMKCHKCRAGKGSSSDPLFYKPKENCDHPKKPHPAQHKDQKKSERIKEARKWENKEAKRIGKPTAKSGSVHGDGDCRSLINGREVKIEFKDRGKRKSFNLSLDEYKKGQAQGVEAYGIKIEDDQGKSRIVYLLDKELFEELTS